MTYDDVAKELAAIAVESGEHVHILQGDGLDTVSLQVVPVAWFIAMRSAGHLSMGIYEGEDNRLVGQQQIPFAELTSAFIQEKVGNALARKTSLTLDPEAVRQFFQSLPPDFRNRRTGPAGNS